MSIDFDLRAFSRGLDQAIADYEARGERALDDLAEHVVTRAKAAARVDTGETRDRIVVVARGRDAQGPYVDVGVAPTEDRREIYNEFGTEKLPPQPFMRPAFAEAPARFGKGGA